MKRTIKIIIVFFVIWVVFLSLPDYSPSTDEAQLKQIASKYYSSGFLKKTAEYHQTRLHLFFLQTSLVIMILYALSRCPIGKWSQVCLKFTNKNVFAARFIMLSGIYLAFSILRLPFSLARYFHARSFDLRHDTPGVYMVDWLKNFSVGWLIVMLVGLILLGLFARLRKYWWLASASAVSVFALAMTMATPLIIDPLYYNFKPLENNELKTRMLAIAHRAGIDTKEILVADASRRSRSMNAYFSGFGSTRQIVVFDTLVNKLNDKEILSVIAHEAAHWQQNHIYKGLGLGILGVCISLFIIQKILDFLLTNKRLKLSGRFDPGLGIAAYGLYVIFMYIALIPSNWVSRSMETQADRIALQLTHDPKTFIGSKVQIAQQNLSNVAPPGWVELTLFTHPSNTRRILMAENFNIQAQSNGLTN